MTIINMAVGKGAGGGATPVQPEGIETSLDYFALLAGGQIQTNPLQAQWSQTYAHKYYMANNNTIGIGYRGARIFLAGGNGNVYGSSWDTLYSHMFIVYKQFNGEWSGGEHTFESQSQHYYSYPGNYTITCNGIYEKTDKSELVLNLSISCDWNTYIRYVVITPTTYSINESYSITGYTTLTNEVITEVSMGLKDYTYDAKMAPTIYFPGYETN